MRVLVTGASGFMGRQVVTRLAGEGLDVIATSRQPVEFRIRGVRTVEGPELGPEADWTKPLLGVERVVHLAGLAHVTREGVGAEVEARYHRVNADGSRRLAEVAREAGVEQFIQMSSAHAVAAASETCLSADMEPRPVTAYGRSKLAAERAVREIFEDAELGWLILRPPLVYGPGQVANFARLANWVRKGWPLPFGAVQNRRSFVGVENLADLIVHAVVRKPMRNRIFYPSDQHDVSTPELIELLAAVMGVDCRLWPIPERSLRLLGRLPGFQMIDKLVDSLFVDGTALRSVWEWEPPRSLEEGLRAAVGSDPVTDAGGRRHEAIRREVR